MRPKNITWRIGKKYSLAVVPVLAYPDQCIGIKAEGGSLLYQLVFYGVGQGFVSRQNPQVFPIRPGYQRPLIVILVQRDDMVATIKRAKEGNFQRSNIVRAGKQRAAFGLFPALAAILKPPVDDFLGCHRPECGSWQ
jgi:hypothetical protein